MVSLKNLSDPNLVFDNNGKVRVSFNFANDKAKRAIIATDRISAFDVVMDQPVPGKGRLLTTMTVNWIRELEKEGLLLPLSARGTDRGVFHHLITDSVKTLDISDPERNMLTGRTMIVRKAIPLPVELIVRGYLEGSGWKSYRENGTVCDLALPTSLCRCDRLPMVLFTPSTKAEQGMHDENISFERMVEILDGFLEHKCIPIEPVGMANALRRMSLDIYAAAHAYALKRGVIIADTKLEFGLIVKDGVWCLILIDELLTPDSSRLWDAEKYVPGSAQDSFDKQILRNWLEELCQKGEWRKLPPPPRIDQRILDVTAERYVEINRRLFG